jgi:excisionase family DNA binding protein
MEGSAMPGYNAARGRSAPKSTAPKVLYRAEEAAELMSLSRTAVFGLIRSGDLDTILIGHRRRIPRSSIDAYVKRLLEAGNNAATVS